MSSLPVAAGERAPAGEEQCEDEEAWSDVLKRVEALFASRDDVVGLAEALSKDPPAVSGGLPTRSVWSSTTPFSELAAELEPATTSPFGVRKSQGRRQDASEDNVPPLEELEQGEQLASEPRRACEPGGPAPRFPISEPSSEAFRTEEENFGRLFGNADEPPRKVPPRPVSCERVESHAGHLDGSAPLRIVSCESTGGLSERPIESPVPSYVQPPRRADDKAASQQKHGHQRALGAADEKRDWNLLPPPGSWAPQRGQPQECPGPLFSRVLPPPESDPKGGAKGNFRIARLGVTELARGSSAASQPPERAPEPPDQTMRVAYIDIPRHSLKDFKTFAKDVTAQARREVAADNPYVKALCRHRAELQTCGVIPDPAEEPSLAQQMGTEREALSLMTPLLSLRAPGRSESMSWRCCAEEQGTDVSFLGSTPRTPRRAAASAYLAVEREESSMEEFDGTASVRPRDETVGNKEEEWDVFGV